MGVPALTGRQRLTSMPNRVMISLANSYLLFWVLKEEVHDIWQVLSFVGVVSSSPAPHDRALQAVLLFLAGCANQVETAWPSSLTDRARQDHGDRLDRAGPPSAGGACTESVRTSHQFVSENSDRVE